MADNAVLFKYIVNNLRLAQRQNGDLHAQTDLRRQRLRHANHQSVWSEGDPLSTPGAGMRASAHRAAYIGGFLLHAQSLLAITNPTINTYNRLVPGYEAPVSLVYSSATAPRACASRSPAPARSQSGSSSAAPTVATRISRSPPSCWPPSTASGTRSAPDPLDKDLYELPPDELADVDTVPDVAARRDGGALQAGPRVPAGRVRRVHRRPDRDVDRPEAGPPRSGPDAGCARTRTSSSSTTTSRAQPSTCVT